MFYPGMAGAEALASTLFGRSNRFGRMPYTVYPADWVHSNKMTDMDVTHQRTYRYMTTTEPVVPFGFGLSYSVGFCKMWEPSCAAPARRFRE